MIRIQSGAGFRFGQKSSGVCLDHREILDQDNMYVVQHRETKLYHGYCHTVGDDVWLEDINNPMVEKYKNKDFIKMDMNWVPWHRWFTHYKIVEIC